MHASRIVPVLLFTLLQSQTALAEFRILHAFNGEDGMDAYNQVLVHEDKLYSTAVRGGAHNKGTLVALDLANNALTVLHHFKGTDGRSPFNLTAVHDNKLWGVTRSDEVSYKGTLFSYDLGVEQIKLDHRFDGAPSEPDHTLYGPTVVESQLYGMSNLGGSNNLGAIYRYDPALQELMLLHSFAKGGGTRPFAGLLWHDGWLIGTASDITLRTASDAPNTTQGVIFRLRPDGSNYEIMYRFQGGVKGGHPYGNLVSDGRGWFYGTTLGEYNSIDDEGVVFRIDSNFNDYEVLHDFSEQSGDGSKPNGDLLLSADGKTLYGFSHGTLTAPVGEDSPFFGKKLEAGTLFQIDTNGENFSVMHRFDSAENGLVPERTPVLRNGVLYGAAAGGGEHRSAKRPDGMGIIFSYTLPQ